MRLTQSGTKMKTLKTDGSDLQTAGIGLRIRGVPECGRICALPGYRSAGGYVRCRAIGLRVNPCAARMPDCGRIRVLQDVGVRANTFAAGMVSDGRTDAGGK